MNDMSVRSVLLESVPDAPPMPYTAETLLAAGARARRRRYLAGAGGSLAVIGILMASALVVPALSGSSQPGWPSAPMEPPSRPWSALDPTPFCETAQDASTAFDTYHLYYAPEGLTPVLPPDRLSARLTCHLTRVVPSYLPGATFYFDPDQVPDPRAFPFVEPPLTVERDESAAAPTFSAGAIVADAAGVGTVAFTAAVAGPLTPDEMIESCRARASICEPRSGPYGEIVTVVPEERWGGFRRITVTIHIGHTIVSAVATNVDPTARPGDAVLRWDGADALGREYPPLGAEELIAIIDTSAFTIPVD